MKKILLAIACVTYSLCHAQTITIDLSKNPNKTFSQTIDPVVLRQVVLTNKVLVSSGTYSIEIKREIVTIPPIDRSGFSGGKGGACKPLNDATDNLTQEQSESKIPEHIIKLQDEIDKAVKAGTCGGADVTNAKKAIQSTIEHVNLLVPIDIKPGEKLTITITKDKNNVWTYVLTTATYNPWSIMYGFTFVPNIMNPITNYFSEAVPNSNTFAIKPKNNDRNDFFSNISPTILFQWKPQKKYSFNDTKGKGWTLVSNNFYQFGFSGGLSLNFAKETSGVSVMIGPSILFADNISISFGPCLTPKSVLKGQYAVDHVIPSNLDFDQLHEKRYLAEWFVTFAVRFDQNPFKKDEKKE